MSEVRTGTDVGEGLGITATYSANVVRKLKLNANYSFVAIGVMIEPVVLFDSDLSK